MPAQKNIIKIIEILKDKYSNAKIALKYNNPLELLIATILSAQCTDIMVNKVTENLFKKYKKSEDYASANLIEFEKEIHSCGFYHNKAKNIINSAKIINEKYKGKIPATMEELISLPGVARKTANIVLGNAFGIAAGIPVDTHVRRLSQRLGLTKENDPEKIEKNLMILIPKPEWLKFSYLLIEHGRNICKAKKPRCEICPLQKFCFYFNTLF
ncbi:endonuclease III [Candidatus Desantisbacteria bacterium]|nr:endonuclease III [Candidatus Desantisbacteria bacterium]